MDNNKTTTKKETKFNDYEGKLIESLNDENN